MPPRSPSGDDDERSPRTPREEDARSTASSQRSARKDDDDARSTTSSRRSARKTPRANDEDDDDLASVQSEQDAAVAKARALRLLLAFEDSGHKLRDVLKNKDYDAEALLDAFVGREHLKELGNDECDALIEKAGDGVSVTRDQLGHWLKLERSRLCEELMQRLAPAPAPAPAPAVPEGEAVPMSPLSPARSDVSSGSDLGDLLFSRLDTLPREAGLWVAAACTGLAGGLAYKHWATKKYGGEANRLVAEAKRAAVAGDASTACARYEECLKLVRSRGGAHQRFGEATATLARAAANACEDAGERRRAEALWRSALDGIRQSFCSPHPPSPWRQIRIGFGLIFVSALRV